MHLGNIFIFLLLPSFMLAQICTRYATQMLNNEYKNVIIQDCCPGYNRNSGGLRCAPVCLPNCENGICVGPNKCMCYRGFEHVNSLPANRCVPKCIGDCSNGQCISPNVCKCLTGYKFDVSKVQCLPFCSSGCPNGYCETPEVCQCNEGFKLNQSTQICHPSGAPEKGVVI